MLLASLGLFVKWGIFGSFYVRYSTLLHRIESRTVATVALKAGRFYDTARSHPPTRLDLIYLYITKLTMLCKGISYTNLCDNSRNRIQWRVQWVYKLWLNPGWHISSMPHFTHHKIKRRELLCTFSHTNSRYTHLFFSSCTVNIPQA